MSNTDMENLQESYNRLKAANVKLRKKNKDLRKEVKRYNIWSISSYTKSSGIIQEQAVKILKQESLLNHFREELTHIYAIDGDSDGDELN